MRCLIKKPRSLYSGDSPGRAKWPCYVVEVVEIGPLFRTNFDGALLMQIYRALHVLRLSPIFLTFKEPPHIIQTIVIPWVSSNMFSRIVNFEPMLMLLCSLLPSRFDALYNNREVISLALKRAHEVRISMSWLVIVP
jgi:hypothetical protein